QFCTARGDYAPTQSDQHARAPGDGGPVSLNIPEGYELHYAIMQPDGTLASIPGTNQPAIFLDRSGAEHILGHFRQDAARMGITSYAGRVVYRLCSPFIDPNDPIVETIGQIETWLKSQGGQG
ncbi:hypothetical protein ACLXNF_21845, partial [Mycobacteroides chelonae]|uniref:hypothetical protein n=1 Tax=Mycobacteroides chelonae TaxID=1774 RepID=UPI0039E8ED87